jgi:hypothetical protein
MAPVESIPAAWEEALAHLERDLEHGRVDVAPAERDVQTELQLILAQQLRELIHAIRPVLKHPLLRRF